MLIIISNPTPIPNEANHINALFDEGLEVFHLRKPEATVDEVRVLLEKIKTMYHSQIALHQHPLIAKEYSLKRLHFTEVKRKETREEALMQLKQSGYVLSTSIHQTEAYTGLSTCFTYTFFGPVFNSISKQGYPSTITNGFVFPSEKSNSKVIALGGISAANIQEAMKMKFDGVAVLGTIWHKPDESIRQFKALQKAWKQTDQ